VFLIAAAIVAALALFVCATQGPRELQTTVAARPPTLLALWQSYPLLRRVSAQQAALFAAYNASWMTALLELPPHERPLVVIGGSCVGIAAALAAGHFSNRVGQQIMSRAGAASVLLAAVLVLPAAYGSASGATRALFLLAGMALVDAGLQVALVANQTRVQALAPGARSSLAATLTVAGFVGGSIGAGGGSWLWHAVGWQAAIGLVAVAGCLGFSCSFFTSAPKRTELRRFRELLQAVATTTSKLAIDALSACCQHARQSPTWPAASTQREADLRDCRAQPLRQSLFTHARNGRGRHRITRNVRELSPQRM
jgi:predicted MFS family arabinose efflux permease